MDLVAVDAGLVGLAVLAGLPIGQGLGMALTAPVRGNGAFHQLLWVVRQQRAVAGFTGDSSQLKATGGFVVPGGVAGKTFMGLLCLLQIHLK